MMKLFSIHCFDLDLFPWLTWREILHGMRWYLGSPCSILDDFPRWTDTQTENVILFLWNNVFCVSEFFELSIFLKCKRLMCELNGDVVCCQVYVVSLSARHRIKSQFLFFCSKLRKKCPKRSSASTLAFALKKGCFLLFCEQKLPSGAQNLIAVLVALCCTLYAEETIGQENIVVNRAEFLRHCVWKTSFLQKFTQFKQPSGAEAKKKSFRSCSIELSHQKKKSLRVSEFTFND